MPISGSSAGFRCSTFKEALSWTCRVTTSSTPSPAGQLQIGLWCSLCSSVAIEVVSHSGYDWLLLDTEHSPNDVTDILGHLQAAQSGTASCIVRPAWNDMVLIKRYLDIGAQTLLLPFVQTPEEAKRAVEWTRYPPGGVRGITGSGRASRYGRVKDYLKTPQARSACWCRSRPARR